MKKLLAASFTSLVAIAGLAHASMTLRYYNEDSTSYTWKATCSGSSYTVKFEKSTTSSVSIQGSTPCTLHTANGDVKFTGDAKIRIKGGKVTSE